MKVAILGFAREGRSVLKFLKRDGVFKNAEISVLDNNRNIKVPAGIKRETGAGYLKNLRKFDIVFRTPGIPYLLPEIQKAEKSGVKISSATKLFFERCSGTIVGITGTKGKGTTSTLLYKILKAASKKACLAGNIGKPALDILPKADKKSIVVFELSSFQLQDIEKSPSVAAVLDIFPDHLNTHKNLKEYYNSKANIAHYQKRGDKTFFFKNNPLSKKIASKGIGRKIGIDKKSFRIFSPDDLLVKGAHNLKNAAMAATIAKYLGVPDKIIFKTVSKFRGTEHRLELVRKIKLPIHSWHSHTVSRNSHYIYFYNDSASTNPQTAAAAIKSFPNEEKILIVGGQDKNLDYRPLAEALKNSGTKLVILLGENRNKIKKAIEKIKNDELRIMLVNTLFQAVKSAYKFAKKMSVTHSSSFIVLFSPAATSFDSFENYSDRGRKFKKIVKQLE
ncbi:MAG: UDP-N-acetylmuramoyl-L-alanine--D-glutamate ligase [Patescibacteria group bacterium]